MHAHASMGPLVLEQLPIFRVSVLLALQVNYHLLILLKSHNMFRSGMEDLQISQNFSDNLTSKNLLNLIETLKVFQSFTLLANKKLQYKIYQDILNYVG